MPTRHSRCGDPGTISRITHTVKNANSTWLNGKPFDKDLSIALDREVRCANDANCLAVSEATDGAGAGCFVRKIMKKAARVRFLWPKKCTSRRPSICPDANPVYRLSFARQ